MWLCAAVFLCRRAVAGVGALGAAVLRRARVEEGRVGGAGLEMLSERTGP